MRHPKRSSQCDTTIRAWIKGALGVKIIKDHSVGRRNVSTQGILKAWLHVETPEDTEAH